MDLVLHPDGHVHDLFWRGFGEPVEHFSDIRFIRDRVGDRVSMNALETQVRSHSFSLTGAKQMIDITEVSPGLGANRHSVRLSARTVRIREGGAS